MQTHAAAKQSASQAGKSFFGAKSTRSPFFSPALHGGARATDQAKCRQCSGVPRIQRDAAGGGSTEFSDTVPLPPQTSRSGVISGTVERTETAPASGAQPRQQVSSAYMNVVFDPSPRACRVTIPFNYRFVQAAPADHGPCNAGPAPAPMSPNAFRRLQANVLRAVRSGLNGWFDVQLTGRSCPIGCADRPLPINVEVDANDAGPGTTVTVFNRAGRSDDRTICAREWMDSTAVHEGGHQVLGVGDEYHERDERLRAVRPEWFRDERVRRDYSRMGPEQHSRFAMFQERHFAAVATFLSHIYPGCDARLVARARPTFPDFRFNFGAGFAAVSGLPGYFTRLGFDFGIPIDRMRRWEFTIGPELSALLAAGDQRLQAAFLLGARLGLEGSTGEAGLGVTGSAFVSGGYGRFFSSDPLASVTRRNADAPYGEVGARFGIRSPLEGLRFNFGVEGAAGAALGTPGVRGPIGRDIASDPARTHWFRVGIDAALQF